MDVRSRRTDHSCKSVLAHPYTNRVKVPNVIATESDRIPSTQKNRSSSGAQVRRIHFVVYRSDAVLGSDVNKTELLACISFRSWRLPVAILSTSPSVSNKLRAAQGISCG